MKQKILTNIENPEALEKLYREDKRRFSYDFKELTSEKDTELIRFWKIRLSDETEMIKGFSFQDLIAVVAISLLTIILVKLPVIFPSINEELFYTRDLAIITFNGLILYTFRQNKMNMKGVVIYGLLILILVVYVNLLPLKETDSLTIALFHIPLFLWCLFGASYISLDFRDVGKRIGFIRFNGELIIMTGLLILTGGILTIITLGLFSAIGWNIEKIYLEYIVVPGATVMPILASYLINLYPEITKRIVPVIARVFTPVVLATLLIYLVSLFFSKIRILEDRNLLIVFNALLVAVLAIIVFSVTELNKFRNRNIQVLILIMLAVVTLIINSVALIAIITRLTYGLTPNRTVVLITNLLVFFNLILITKDLFRSYTNSGKLDAVEKTVAQYLTVYFIWTAIAVFILPAVFGFD